MADEYLQQELDDAVDIINWLVKQPWCSGKVGMMGISWGGFNSLQVAAMKPDPLKAIVTVCSSADRFADRILHGHLTLIYLVKVGGMSGCID